MAARARLMRCLSVFHGEIIPSGGEGEGKGEATSYRARGGKGRHVFGDWIFSRFVRRELKDRARAASHPALLSRKHRKYRSRPCNIWITARSGVAAFGKCLLFTETRERFAAQGSRVPLFASVASSSASSLVPSWQAGASCSLLGR